MGIDEFARLDVGFQENKFLTKANSRIKKIYNGITLEKLDEVKHFMSEELFQKLFSLLKSYQDSGKRVIYDEVNVVCQIYSYEVSPDYFKVTVICDCRYLNYFLSSSTMEYLSGDMENRKKRSQKIVFLKKRNAKENSIFRCVGCGANFNINENGICPSCGRVYDLDDFDYILKDMEL